MESSSWPKLGDPAPPPAAPGGAGSDDSEDERGGAAAPWMPPGADAAEESAAEFGAELEPHFQLPARLKGKSDALISAANDFHYAMINDLPRNEFFRSALQAVLDESSHVLEIGTGSGLLAMIAAKQGAASVTAVEANRHMAEMAQRNIDANGLTSKIAIVNKLSTEVEAEDMPQGQPNVLVSEILGTLLLGESALDYVQDARERLLAPGGVIIPAAGCQYATLIESADLESITEVQGWGGLDLSAVNMLQDTVSLVFTKQYGFRFSSIRHRVMAPRVTVASIDFYTDSPGCLPAERRVRLQAAHTGRVHGILCTWEVFADRERTLSMSTDPEETRENFPRDMQWGQGLQLLEDREGAGAGVVPKPFMVTAGEWLELVVFFSSDSVLMQFLLERADGPSAAEGGDAMKMAPAPAAPGAAASSS